MPRRQGATLVEVLVAIFVMGLGLIALLTLFPLGAIRMAQAIQDDRCATAVANADAIAKMDFGFPPQRASIRNDALVRTPTWFPNIDVFKDTPPAGARSPADPNG